MEKRSTEVKIQVHRLRWFLESAFEYGRNDIFMHKFDEWVDEIIKTYRYETIKEQQTKKFKYVKDNKKVSSKEDRNTYTS